MKRFWKEAAADQVDGGWRVTLDGRAVRTQGGQAQVVPTRSLAKALAAEWANQGAEIDARGFPLRDLTDLALDVVAPGRVDAVARLLPYAETDTLCYRADPDEPLYRRQHALWEPILAAAEARHGVIFERVSGVIHRPQPAATLARLRGLLDAHDDFTIAALMTLAPLAASLTVALAALEPDADLPALFAAANAEQDWQAEQWGWEWTAEELRAERLATFETAARFAALARTRD